MKMSQAIYDDLLTDIQKFVEAKLRHNGKTKLESAITMGDMWKLWGRVEQERSYHPESGLREKLAELTAIPLSIPYRADYRHGQALEGLNDAHAVTAFKRMLPVLQSVEVQP
jgi:hypothetical protein